MTMAKLELAAQRYTEAEQALTAARDDLVVEAVAVLRARQDRRTPTEVDVARITGWSVEEVRRLLAEAVAVGVEPAP
ncbi:hypothetical protein [Streptomyces tsukubensis]|uniref:Uncharacterized protein n=1 Tax=Streptomyces tsukubensis TaxID=83656 RepID=A0A1V4AFL0_9ACTN|nr:hypothetical protein [Streptomyces tsukubensis]OON82682.1 hypothetical protein B1H18_01070 [Streptomyces tsukubensis]QFR92149.1 hypothetical protein GBW32_02615 [Streptomyces tsukubensis]